MWRRSTHVLVTWMNHCFPGRELLIRIVLQNCLVLTCTGKETDLLYLQDRRRDGSSNPFLAWLASLRSSYSPGTALMLLTLMLRILPPPAPCLRRQTGEVGQERCLAPGWDSRGVWHPGRMCCALSQGPCRSCVPWAPLIHGIPASLAQPCSCPLAGAVPVGALQWPGGFGSSPSQLHSSA